MFKPGQSGNPNGRPKGAVSKAGQQVKEAIETFLTDQSTIDKLKAEMETLKGRDFLRAYCDLLPYIVPKLQSTSMDVELESLSNEQLDELWSRIERMSTNDLKNLERELSNEINGTKQ